MVNPEYISSSSITLSVLCHLEFLLLLRFVSQAVSCVHGAAVGSRKVNETSQGIRAGSAQLGEEIGMSGR